MAHRYLAEITSAAGAALGTVALDPDWGPAREWCNFQGVRDGRRLHYANAGPAVIEPVWHAESGPPYVGALRIALVDADGQSFHCEVPTRFLRPDVEKAAADLVTRGTLATGERFGFRLCAHADPAADRYDSRGLSNSQDADDDLDGDAVGFRVELEPASLAEVVAASRRHGETDWDDNDLPVFVPARVLADLEHAACAEAQVESGAILLGKLCVDTDSGATRPEVFLRITEQIPAEHTIAERASLTFTGETWAAAERVRRLRGMNELTGGWQHLHPEFCASCPPANRAVCPLSRPMFSAADINVHRTVFAHAYQVALLLSFLGEDRPRLNMYAWRDGQVAARGFYIC